MKAIFDHIFKPGILILGLAALVACSGGGNGNNNDFTPAPEPEDPNIIRIEAGPDFETDLKTALIEAQPGNIIVLPEGEFEMTGGLILDVSNVTVRGQGEAATVLNFARSTGGDGFLVSGSNNNALENFAVVDAPGDAIKFQRVNGVTIRGMRVEWTCGACDENGAYGIYPVKSQNVLIEDSIAIGASDAGIYVGQSDKVIVASCTDTSSHWPRPVLSRLT